MHRILAVLSLTLFGWGCANSPNKATELSPIQAIMAAADHPEGIRGVFRFEVRGGGRQSGWLYINSEADYRDQRCLTIAFPQEISDELEAQFHADPVSALHGKILRVTGVAQRTTIWFYSYGIRTDKYYYQTHVRVTDLSQVEILN